MKLYLVGHNQKYAVEQIMLQTYPAERPEYVASPPSDDELHAVIKISRATHFTTVSTVIRDGGASYSGFARVRIDQSYSGFARVAAQSDTTDDVAQLRTLRRAIKNSFFRAAQRAHPGAIPWGSAAGVRPASLITKMLQSGMTEREAAAKFRREYYVSSSRVELAFDCARVELDARASIGERDVAVYVGIPFCPTRCAYCSFVSMDVEKSLKLVEPFLDALLAETDALGATLRRAGASVVSIYIGGGTPTTLNDAQLEQLLARIDTAFDLSHLREYTVEAGRPDTITDTNMAILHRHGVSRVSVNPQTFSDDVLREIGRRHSTEDTYRAMDTVRSAGFETVNMDLIAGLPGDTISGFRASLDAAISLSPENITVHALSRKRGSRVKLEETPVPPGAEVSEMLDYAAATLRKNGYAPYYLYRQKFSSGGFENTGWTKPGHVNLYNIAMMDEAMTVLSLGGGGVSKLIRDSGKIIRIFNPKYPYEYIERREEIISRKREVEDFLQANPENNIRQVEE
jgi:oxygen-independent coproporphyrinogen-3 oxidase